MKSLMLFGVISSLSLAMAATLSPRHKGGCIVLNNNKLFCFGGASSTNNPTYLNDNYFLDLSRDYADLNTLNNAWQPMSPGLEPTSEFVMVASGSMNFLINGGTGSANGKPMQYQTVIYDSVTNAWTSLPSANATNSLYQARGATGAIDSATYIGNNNLIYIWGGEMDPTIGSTNTSYSGSILTMNAITGAWNPTVTTFGGVISSYTPRIGHAMILDYATMSVIGGQEAKYDGTRYNLSPASMTTIPQFNTITITWVLANVTGDIPTPRSYHSVTTVDVSHTILYGGLNTVTNQPVQDTMYSGLIEDGTVTWQRLSPSGTGPGPLYGHAAVKYMSGTLLLIGGVDSTGQTTSNINVYSSLQNTWRSSFSSSGYYSSNGNSGTSSSNSTVCPSCSGGYSSSSVNAQQAVAAGIGAGGFVLFALIGAGLFFTVERSYTAVATSDQYAIEQMQQTEGYLKVELDADPIEHRPLPPSPFGTSATSHANQYQPTGEAASYLQHHPQQYHQ
ncbi:uncharacterized protein BX664DRAFT_324384 [Halteromyces radiatus]|uniref:uncharacterized protein n=1 Tax=Halteromyces radiatus TaxID=101107 RepID=UPI00221F9792|nr:uncharacterized protein BX664DRAFT_324384 [Halteromyces radiatus]KAI8096611.1 hypothetical protein BX664DRAFT_324384 [Halteromyces radiatus]